MTHQKLVGNTVLSGLVAGWVVSGIGGRVAMRIPTVTLEKPSRFSVVGTLQVIGAGAAHGVR